MRDGSLSVEARTNAQVAEIRCLTQINDLSIKVEKHATLNTSKGVVTCRDFLDDDIASIKNVFAAEGVIDIRRISRKENGILIPTSSVILTFDNPTLPSRLTGYLYPLNVRQYIPNPLRCFQCQKFGHTRENCSTKVEICVNCAQPAHEDTCTRNSKCVNCLEGHASNSRLCPVFQIEKEIQIIRVSEKTSFPEARKLYKERHPVQQRHSYADSVTLNKPFVFGGRNTQPPPPTPTITKVSPKTRSFGCQANWPAIISSLHDTRINPQPSTSSTNIGGLKTTPTPHENSQTTSAQPTPTKNNIKTGERSKSPETSENPKPSTATPSSHKPKHQSKSKSPNSKCSQLSCGINDGSNKQTHTRSPSPPRRRSKDHTCNSESEERDSDYTTVHRTRHRKHRSKNK